jgi:hypothetical protein
MAWWQFDKPGIIDNDISGANARLIAAAPDLLAALELALNFIDDTKIHTMALNAIEKATGNE